MASWRRESVQDLGRAATAGISTVNSYRGVRTTADRLARCRTLVEGDLPVPRFQYGRAEEIDLKPPVLVKPRSEFGPDAHDFGVIYRGPIAFEGERFVQKYITPRRSYKVFRVGDEIRSTQHNPPDGALRADTPSRRVVDMTDTVRDLFELTLFELDIVVHKALYVIDVNPVVSLEGVADAVEIYEELLWNATQTS